MRENFGWCRGKRTDNGEWVEGYYLRTKHYHCIITACVGDERVVYGNYADVIIYAVDPETVGECTNVPDKNSVLIFEGDILKSSFGEKHIVRFRFGTFELLHRAVATPMYAYIGTDAEFEIIGTVHDNLELLKE